MDRVRQLPVGSERVTTDSFSRWPGKRSHMARLWAQAVLLPNQSEARGADRLASRRYSGANFRRCGVLVWAANLILAALDCDLRAPQGFRFAPCRLLIAVTRATGNDEHKPLNGVFAPLLATAVGTIIRRGEHSRGRQFSWTNQCEELTAGSARRGGLEFVLTEWLYVGVDPRPRRLGVFGVFCEAPIGSPAFQAPASPWQKGGCGALLRFCAGHLPHRSASAAGRPCGYRYKSDAPDGSESESNLPFFEDGRSLGGEEPALLPLETGAQRSWSARSNTVSNVQMSPSESSPTARPCTVRRRAVAALGS
jgi:Replication initiator protein A